MICYHVVGVDVKSVFTPSYENDSISNKVMANVCKPIAIEILVGELQ